MKPARLLAGLFLAIPLQLFSQLSFESFYGPSGGTFSCNDIESDGHGRLYTRVQDFSFQNDAARLICSEDGGKHWAERATQPGWRYFIGRDGILYALQSGRLFKSVDQGVNWEMVAAATPAIPGSQLTAGETGILNLINPTEIYRSVNGGISWQLTQSYPFSGLQPVYNWPALGGLWIARKSAHNVEIWQSTDEGASWQNIKIIAHEFESSQFPHLQPGPNDAIYIDLGGSDYNRIARSIDKGVSWQESMVLPYSPARILSISALPSGEVVARLNNMLWYHSLDQGLNWSLFTPGWPSGFRELHRLVDGQVFASGTVNLHLLDNATGAWNYIADQLTFFTHFTWTNPDNFVGLYRGALMYINSGNTEYQLLNMPGFDPSSIESDKQGNLYLLDYNYLIRLPGPDTLFRSSNTPSKESFSSFAIGADGVLYVLAHDYLHHSTDNGATWTSSNPVSVYHSFGQLAVSAAGPVYVSDFNRVWRSTDGGKTLDLAGDGCCFDNLATDEAGSAFFMRNFYSCPIGSIAVGDATWKEFGVCPIPSTGTGFQLKNILPKGPGQFWAGGQWEGEPAVFYSSDEGQTWERTIVSHLQNATVSDLTFSPDGRLYTTVRRDSPFQIELYRSTGAVLSSDPPASESNRLKLYPNPTAGRLRVDLPQHSGTWSLHICDLPGRKLLDLEQASGPTEINLPEPMPPGSYLLIAENTGTHRRIAGFFIKE